MKLFFYVVALFFLAICVHVQAENKSSPRGPSSKEPSSYCRDSHTNSTFYCVKYKSNYDGDTVTVNIPNVHPLLGKDINIRVLGVDTPEMYGTLPCEKEKALEAKKFVKNHLINAKNIKLTGLGRGKYFRIVADIVADGKSIAKLLEQKKLAYPYFGGTKKRINWCTFSPM